MNSIKAITFDELVEYGKTHGANIVDGIPRSFTYECRRVTHENDNLYIIGNLQFHRGQLLVCETISPGSDILSVWVDASDPYIQAVGHLYADKQNLSAESFRATMNAPYGTAKPTVQDTARFPMTEQKVREWIDACNYEPCRQVLRDYLRLRAAQPRATPSDEELTIQKNAKRYVEFREHACTASWEEKGRVGIEFSNKLDGIEHPTHEQFDNAFDAALNPAKKQDEPCDCDADKYNKLPHHADCAVLTAQPRAVPDAKAMAYRFMGWRLPEDFAPDAGISFKHMTDPAWTHDTWPVGTNLFTVDQAEQMFRYVLNVKDEDQVCGVCGEPNTYDPEGGVCKECQGVVEKHKSGKVENLQSGAIDLLKELRDLAGYIENGSGTTVKLFQDDATAEWFCTVGKKEYHASTFIGAIEAAVKGNDHD